MVVGVSFGAWLVSGCQARTGTVAKPPAAPPAATTLAPTVVSDAAFGSAVHSLLRDGTPSASRSNLLAGALARALAHASERFASHEEERGMATLFGAFGLVRAGEFRPEIVAPGAAALKPAIELVSQHGDEGRALALLSVYRSTLPDKSPARADADEHLSALTNWTREAAPPDSIEALGVAERIAVSRVLFEPLPEVEKQARDAVVAWVERALAYSEQRTRGMPRARREDEVEAFRALRSGTQTLAYLYLRNGDAAGAYSELSVVALRRLTPPPLFDRLDAVANGSDAASWRELLTWLWSPNRRGDPGGDPEEDSEFAVDANLQRAALFGTAIETYRRDPRRFDMAGALATLLVQNGLGEAAPLVLADGALTEPDTTKLGAALRFVLQAIVREDEAEDPASARRIYQASEPLLRLSSSPEFVQKVDPSAARVRFVMAAIEIKAANLGAARGLLESAVAAEPSAEGFEMLAGIERQQNRPDAALADLARGLATRDAKQDPVESGEARLLTFEVERETGALDRARADLSRALADALLARKGSQKVADRTRSERLLARILDRFSDAAGASRALERAYAAAGDDKRQVAAVVLDAGARALLLADVSAARLAVDRALSAELADEHLVYVALWLQLLHRDRKMQLDGSAVRALGSIRDDGRWPGRLASWGLGRIKDQELAASARTQPQKTEAAFYLALAKKASGDVIGTDAGLREVVRSPAIDLVEVQLARDLLAGPGRNLPGPPPQPAP